MRKLFVFFMLTTFSAEIWAQMATNTKNTVAQSEHLFQMAEDLFEQQPDSAMKYYQAVIPMAETEKNWNLYVKSSCILNNIFYKRQAYEMMEEYAQKAFEIAIKYLSPRETIFIAATNNLGTYHYIKGDYEMAASIMRQTITMLEAQAKPNPIHLAKCYGNLGRYHQKRGDFNEGLQYYKTAARIKAEHESTYSGLSRAVSQHLIGRAFRELNQADSAIQYFHAAKTLLNNQSQAQYQRKKLDVILSLVDAFLHLNQADSVSFYSRQFQGLQKTATPLQQARFLGLNARLASSQKDYAAALLFLDQAKLIREQKYGPKHAEIADLHRQIGQIYQQNGQLQEAIEAYKQGLTILKRSEDDLLLSGSYRHPIEAFSLLKALAEAQEQNNAPEKALAYYQEAADLVQFIRSSFYSLEAKYFWNEGRFASVFGSIVSLCEQQYRLTHDPKYFEQAFAAAEANKAFVLYENQQKQLARIQTQLPDSIWKEGQKIEREIQFYQQKLWAAEAKVKGKTETYKEQLFSWQQAHDRWQANLKIEYPDYYQQTLAPIKLLALDSLQKQLSPNAVLLEYFRSEKAYYIFSISQDSVSFQKLASDPKTLESHLDSLYEQLFVREPSLDAFASFSSLSSKIYQQLLGPYLDEARFAELIVIPDGQIGYLPFELLTSKEQVLTTESSVRQWREYPYLLHDYAIQYAYSASLLFAPTDNTPTNYNAQWLGVAPAYKANLALTHNQAEVKALSQQLNGSLLLGEDAHKEGFIQQAAEYQILHLAMHGFADSEDPMHAHLAFSQVAEQSLYAWEIPYLSLKTDLVVLSACESGYGKFQAGEGVMSLARAFSLAGCKSVINTLWTADDAASQRINELFYPSLLAGKNKADALRKAKIAYLKEAPPHAIHPHYWAAFVLTGSAEPLMIQSSTWYFWVGGILIFLLLGGIISFQARKSLKT
ncbi:MAG: CHAT domain-containing protein [Bacteroidia bacterium]